MTSGLFISIFLLCQLTSPTQDERGSVPRDNSPGTNVSMHLRCGQEEVLVYIAIHSAHGVQIRVAEYNVTTMFRESVFDEQL
jgi:hypothetical protein